MEPSEDAIRQITSMGISREEAIHALKVKENNVNMAVDFIFSGGSTSSVGAPTIGIPATDVNVPTNVPAYLNNPETSDSSKVGPITVKDEDEFQKALSLSLQENYKRPEANASTATSGVAGLGEDENLQRAVELSLQDARRTDLPGSWEPVNPHERAREDGVPAGLKNIGNTCYVNSLLQTYFSLPSFRNEVLAYVPPTDAPKPGGDQDTEMVDVNDSTSDNKNAGTDATAPISHTNLVVELRRLFSQLLLSKRKYCDPTAVMKALLDAKGQPVEVGNQQDVSEFNHLFLQRVDEGLAGNSKPDDKTPGLSQRLFGGKLVQELTALEADGSTENLPASNCEVGQIILDVSEGELHAGLEQYCSTKVDNYVTANGHVTTAHKTVWFESFPPVLTFQLQRVRYDVDSMMAVKVNTPFDFPKEVYMDRYLFANRETTLGKRKETATLRTHRDRVLQQLKLYTEFNGRGMLDEILEASRNYVEEYEATASGQDSKYAEAKEAAGLESEEVLKTTVGVLSRMQTRAKKCRLDLEQNLKDVNSEIAGKYAQLNKLPYELHAVLVHDGGAGSGHYWVYLRDQAAGGWRKFSDTRIDQVPEEEVWHQSVGGTGAASAYCLFYTRADEAQQPPVCTVAPDLQAEADESNAKFAQEIADWDSRQLNEKVATFHRLYADAWDECQRVLNEVKTRPSFDPRLRSLGCFLLARGEVDVLAAVLTQQLYYQVWGANCDAWTSPHIQAELRAKSSNCLLPCALPPTHPLRNRITALKAEYAMEARRGDLLLRGLNLVKAGRCTAGVACILLTFSLFESEGAQDSPRPDYVGKALVLALEALSNQLQRAIESTGPTEGVPSLDLLESLAAALYSEPLRLVCTPPTSGQGEELAAATTLAASLSERVETLKGMWLDSALRLQEAPDPDQDHARLVGLISFVAEPDACSTSGGHLPELLARDRDSDNPTPLDIKLVLAEPDTGSERSRLLYEHLGAALEQAPEVSAMDEAAAA